MITFNHEPYIAQAIEGILMQKTSFEIELIIADDASADKTSEIVNNYIRGYPGGHLIKYFRHANNLGMMPNFIFACQEGKGTFIALCEGDDYWTDPLKLQKQVNFLTANSNYSLCAHNASILENEKMMDVRPDFKEQKDIDLNSLIDKNPLLTASFVFRREVFNDLPLWFNKLPFGDYGLLFLCISKGKIRCLADTMSVYRIHSGGIHAKLFASSEGAIKAIDKHLLFWDILLDNIFNKTTYEVTIKKKVISLCQRKANLYAKQHNWKKVIEVKCKMITLRFLYKMKLK